MLALADLAKLTGSSQRAYGVDILAKNMAIMSFFQDKLDCRVFQTLSCYVVTFANMAAMGSCGLEIVIRPYIDRVVKFQFWQNHPFK